MNRSKWTCLCIAALLLAVPAMADDENKFFVGLEFTALQPSGAPMDFSLADPDDDGNPEGTIQSVDFSSGAAPRLMFGWTNNSGGTWILSGWSYDEDEEKMLSATAPAQLWDILYHADDAFDDYEGTALGMGNIEATVYDLVYSMPARKSEKMSVSWQIGLRQASLEQSLAAVYDDLGSTNNVLLGSEADGIGLKGGLRSTIHLSKKWHVSGAASMSLLSGDIDSMTTMFDSFATAADPQVDILSEDDRVITMFDTSVSLVWNPSKAWYLWLGYEYSQWNGVIDTHLFPDDVSEGFIQTDTSDLSWDGATLGAAFAF